MDLDRIIEQALDCKIVSENTVRFLCEKMKEVLIEESNVLQLQSPITVVGDVHGYVLIYVGELLFCLMFCSQTIL